MKLKTSFVMLPACLAMIPTHAADSVPQAVIDTATQYLPGFDSIRIEPSPILGLYMQKYGPNIFYMSADGRHIVRGDVMDITEGSNLTEMARKKARIDSIVSLKEDDMIVFSPQTVDATVTVFTDITCPYCAKFHQEVPSLNENGMQVRYLAYPRVGVPSPVADDMASIWCADDRHQALTDAKAGLGVVPETCPNPVKGHYETGNKVGVEGTPTIILEDGTMLGGYVPYLRLADAARQASKQVLDR